MKDKLKQIFELREKYIKESHSHKPDLYPTEFPIDISTKESQQLVRSLMVHSVEETFEALAELKNWKTHRETQLPDFDKDNFLEEIIDAYNFMTSILVLLGIDENEFYDAFVKKHVIIMDRLKNGY